MFVCDACVLRHQGERDRDAYARACAPIVFDDGSGQRDANAEPSSSSSSVVCGLCLGVLQLRVEPLDATPTRETIDRDDGIPGKPRAMNVSSTNAFVTRALERGHAPGAFKLRVILPAAVLVRERAHKDATGTGSAVTPIDEALRLIVAPALERALGCPEDADGAAYAVTAKYRFGGDARETAFLSAVPLKLTEAERKERHGKHSKMRGGGRGGHNNKRKRGGKEARFLATLSQPEDPLEEEFTAAARAYEDAAKRLSDARFAASDAFAAAISANGPLETPKYPVKCVLETFHEPVIVGGWYVKLDRGVPQSKWIDRASGKRIGRGSVVEAIEAVLLPGLESSGAKFNSSGREDMDVRMLADGRPFASQVHNPKKPLASAEKIAEMEREINARSGETGVRVRGLCLTSKANYHAVGAHAGENEKEKSYVAVVRLSRPVADEDITKLSSTAPLTIQQETPTRVAHRRADLIRPRTIVAMSAERIAGAPDAFLLRLQTQAGTYIKEFVHGDAGRTKPSVGDLLECKAQILQLDVTAINDDWNPSERN